MLTDTGQSLQFLLPPSLPPFKTCTDDVGCEEELAPRPCGTMASGALFAAGDGTSTTDSDTLCTEDSATLFTAGDGSGATDSGTLFTAGAGAIFAAGVGDGDTTAGAGDVEGATGELGTAAAEAGGEEAELPALPATWACAEARNARTATRRWSRKETIVTSCAPLG